jgi:hypothetical protein
LLANIVIDPAQNGDVELVIDLKTREVAYLQSFPGGFQALERIWLWREPRSLELCLQNSRF